MLDFKELPQDGQAFEQLIREIIFHRGLHVRWSGKGPDGGRDLIAVERLTGLFASQERTWLIQCKHFAHADRSVGIADLDDIVDSCNQHGATGYLLACTTQPSSAVVNRIEGINFNQNNPISATFWDNVTIEKHLFNADSWAIAQHFFPESCESWKIFATESPNHFVVHHRGYVFHLSNRIGSRVDYHLKSVDARLDSFESIDFPEGHFIRPRSVYFDDKNGAYSWYIDYMMPYRDRPSISKVHLANMLGDGYALEDGQAYNFDVNMVEYMAFSDHYDKDHYDYYTKYMPNFLSGAPRERGGGREYFATRQEIEELERSRGERKSEGFEKLKESLNKLEFVKVINCWNADVEDLHLFSRRRVWSDLMERINWSDGAFFTARYRLLVNDVDKFIEILKGIPIDLGGMFSFAKEYVCAPGGQIDDRDPIYILTISVSPIHVDNEVDIRMALNKYFVDISDILAKA